MERSPNLGRPPVTTPSLAPSQQPQIATVAQPQAGQSQDTPGYYLLELANSLSETGQVAMNGIGRAALDGDVERLAQVDRDARANLPPDEYMQLKAALGFEPNVSLAKDIARVANWVLTVPMAFRIQDVPATPETAYYRPMNQMPPRSERGARKGAMQRANSSYW